VRTVLLVAATDLRRRFRNRSAIITAIVGPLAMAFVFSSLTGGGTVTFTIGIVDADRSALSSSVVDAMTTPPAAAPAAGDSQGAGDDRDAVRFRRIDDREDALRLLDDADIDGAIVLPAGFAAVADGAPVSIEVLRDPRRRISGQVAESIAQSVASRFERVSLAVRTAAGVDASLVPAVVIATQTAESTLTTTSNLDDGGELTSSAFFGASMSMLFLYFTMAMAARSLLVEKGNGTVGRMIASDAAPASILAGKTLAVASLGLVGFGVVWTSTTVVFGASWGSPLPVVAVILATVVAVAGVGTFVAGFARTERQVDGYVSTITFVFALLGGNFVGAADQPALLRQLSLLTPNGWSLRAFSDLASDAATTGGVAGSVTVLCIVGIAFGGVGARRITKVAGR
jgi:ABC-2 type transport system permease protein